MTMTAVAERAGTSNGIALRWKSPPVQLRPSWSWRRSRLRQTAVPRYPKTTDAFVRPALVGGWVDLDLTKARASSYSILEKARPSSLYGEGYGENKTRPRNVC